MSSCHNLRQQTTTTNWSLDRSKDWVNNLWESLYKICMEALWALALVFQSFGGGFEVRACGATCSKIVRWIRMNSIYLSRLGRLKCRMGNKIGRLNLFVASRFGNAQLGRLNACNRRTKISRLMVRQTEILGRQDRQIETLGCKHFPS